MLVQHPSDAATICQGCFWLAGGSEGRDSWNERTPGQNIWAVFGAKVWETRPAVSFIEEQGWSKKVKGQSNGYIALALADRARAERVTALQLDFKPDETLELYRAINIKVCTWVICSQSEGKDTLVSVRYNACKNVEAYMYCGVTAWKKAVFAMFMRSQAPKALRYILCLLFFFLLFLAGSLWQSIEPYGKTLPNLAHWLGRVWIWIWLIWPWF